MTVDSLIDGEMAVWKIDYIYELFSQAAAKVILSLPLSLCGVENEIAIHALLECGWVRAVWESSEFDVLNKEAPNRESCAHWLVWIWERLDRTALRRYLVMVWALWYIRNARVFEGGIEEPNHDLVLMGFIRMVEVSSYRVEGRVLRTEQGRQLSDVWVQPHHGNVKNTDATIFDNGEVGLGVGVRNASGEVVMVGCRRVCGGWSSEVAEAKVMRFGLKLVRRGGWEELVLQSEAQGAVNAAKNRRISRNLFGLYISNIFSYVSLFSPCLFSHIKRGGNTLAHHAARLCLSANMETVYVENYSDAILVMAEIDLI
ncbi:uncharacterized protein LOC141638148 [Silene latifolia]|uniref:uncharacterized protein LOC141638148 n=1 Tax=Silene latifolia TaxID=37657 RepID=UPI003D77FF18